ncbi:MAG: hypothetical protein PHT94_05210, partial [Candidatus Nanoarchaeia archaeon]|nr:hypothetical protein [Candidatus Nanoarchaeia archaeon]
MSSINLSMSKTIEIIMSVLVILACFGMIYTYDAQGNYLLHFSITKLKIIFDEIVLFHDKGLDLELNEKYPFDLVMFQDQINISMENQKLSTKIEPIKTNNVKTLFADKILLNSYKNEQINLYFENSQITLEFEGNPKPNEFCDKIEKCEF